MIPYYIKYSIQFQILYKLLICIIYILTIIILKHKKYKTVSKSLIINISASKLLQNNKTISKSLIIIRQFLNH